MKLPDPRDVVPRRRCGAAREPRRATRSSNERTPPSSCVRSSRRSRRSTDRHHDERRDPEHEPAASTGGVRHHGSRCGSRRTPTQVVVRGDERPSDCAPRSWQSVGHGRGCTRCAQRHARRVDHDGVESHARGEPTWSSTGGTRDRSVSSHAFGARCAVIAANASQSRRVARLGTVRRCTACQSRATAIAHPRATRRW